MDVISFEGTLDIELSHMDPRRPQGAGRHIIPLRKLDRIYGTLSATFPNFNLLPLERSVQNETWNKFLRFEI